jgi:hypothetical protein
MNPLGRFRIQDYDFLNGNMLLILNNAADQAAKRKSAGLLQPRLQAL